MQGATMDATKGADQHVDINEEGGSQLMRDGGESAKEAGHAGGEVAKAPVKSANIAPQSVFLYL